MRTPRDALVAQAARCRAAWRDLGPDGRARLAAELGDDWLAAAWKRVLAGDHPLADWLDGDEPFEVLPNEWAEGPSPRQLLSSHPFIGWRPWSKRLTFPTSSSTPPGS
jgi:hypothetical protein